MNTRKILSVGIIILGFMLITFSIWVLILQSDNGKLKESIVEKDAIIAEKDITITGLQIDVKKLKKKQKDIIAKWANTIAKAENLKYHLNRFVKCASGLIESWDSIINYCTDIDVPKTKKCLKQFGKVIKDTKKYHIPKVKAGK